VTDANGDVALRVDGSTGAVTVLQDPTTNLGVATKQYVDALGTAIGNAYAPINNPVLTGTPKSVTPTSGDSSTQIATTAYVQNAIAGAVNSLWEGSNKTVSTSGPTNGQGNTGDFWFQI
jgi:hypothetical protein